MDLLISLRYGMHFFCYINSQSSGSECTVSVMRHRGRYIYVVTFYLSLYYVVLLICLASFFVSSAIFI